VINSLWGCGNPVGVRSLMTAVLCRVRWMPLNRAIPVKLDLDADTR